MAICVDRDNIGLTEGDRMLDTLDEVETEGAVHPADLAIVRLLFSTGTRRSGEPPRYAGDVEGVRRRLIAAAALLFVATVSQQ